MRSATASPFAQMASASPWPKNRLNSAMAKRLASGSFHRVCIAVTTQSSSTKNSTIRVTSISTGSRGKTGGSGCRCSSASTMTVVSWRISPWSLSSTGKTVRPTAGAIRSRYVASSYISTKGMRL